MRVKRNPQPMRSFSFSGFNPNGQMAAFTGAAEYPTFGNYGPPSQAGPYYGPPTYDSYGPPPSGAEHQGSDSTKEYQYGTAAANQQPQEYGPKPAAPVDSKEQNNNSVEQQSDNNKQYRGESW